MHDVKIIIKSLVKMSDFRENSETKKYIINNISTLKHIKLT